MNAALADCPLCAAHELEPGETVTCACGAVLTREAAAPGPRAPRRQPREPAKGDAYRLPVGRWCRDDLCWLPIGRAKVDRESLRLEAPTASRTPLATWLDENTPRASTPTSKQVAAALADLDDLRQRVDAIEAALARVERRSGAWFRLLVTVYVQRGGDAPLTLDTYLAQLGLDCADQVTQLTLRWHRENGHVRTSGPREWARRELSAAVAAYDEECGDRPAYKSVGTLLDTRREPCKTYHDEPFCQRHSIARTGETPSTDGLPPTRQP